MMTTAYSRAYMSFRHVDYGAYRITVMEGDEPGYGEGQPLLVSIHGPGLPMIRLTRTGPVPLREDEDGPLPTEGGLIVFGRSKADRPRLGMRRGGED